MTTTEHPVRQLLWCALNALKTAQENHNITSETGLRHYLLEWLSGASRHPEFRSLPGEIMALKALTEKDRNIPIIGTLNTLFHTLFIGLPSLPEDVWGATQEQTTITLH
ncbi:hypothetical protein [Escherichia coli]|uniref:hypothetical protein n=1 Tax=Escherichia coli TaxID=562 RepID=UPI0015E5EA82|nr:hypothetical protein [Escherichia coli]MBA2002957.1 hypothetical protein [Escherichia coli]MBA2017027.1 hypothetical protein [Escherichia coli]MBA2038104.1 hypothetical protein [Escherichia coli]MBA2067536.1 hypothetical protein [Escherichia coli]